MQKPDYLKDYEQHLKVLMDQGFNLDDARFRYVKGLSMLLMHLHDAIKSISMIVKCERYEQKGSPEEYLLQQSLFRNSVLNYTKCFSQSGKGRVSLDKKDVFKNAPYYLSTHNKLIGFRNKFFAHSDDSGLDYVSFATKEESDHIVVKQLYTIMVPLNEFPSYTDVFEFCGVHVKDKIEKSFQSVERQCGKKVYGFGWR